MICPECAKEGKTSYVYPGAAYSTLMMYKHFFDKQGREHCHDPNWTTTHYSCSNGHRWTEEHRPKCWCGE